MTRISDLLLHSQTLKSLELLKQSISGLAAHSRSQGFSKVADAFDADILSIDAKIKHLKELESKHHSEINPIMPTGDTWLTSE